MEYTSLKVVVMLRLLTHAAGLPSHVALCSVCVQRSLWPECELLYRREVVEVRAVGVKHWRSIVAANLTFWHPNFSNFFSTPCR
jgi:hypothetical protein